jgi:hypothetical protein
MNANTQISADAILLRGREVASMVGVTERTIERWGQEGLLARVRIAGTTRYRRADVEALADPQRAKPASVAALINATSPPNQGELVEKSAGTGRTTTAARQSRDVSPV